MGRRKRLGGADRRQRDQGRELADYKRSGYDRGYLAPAGNQTRDEQLKAEMFFLSNMCPQTPVLNQQA